MSVGYVVAVIGATGFGKKRVGNSTSYKRDSNSEFLSFLEVPRE